MSKIHKVFCLLSGGLDSSTTLAIARSDFPLSDIEAVTIDYGQRHKKEAEYASWQAAINGSSHVVIDAKGFMTGMLVDKPGNNEEIPDASYSDLPEGISPTYVSFRNGLMLSILAARAQSWIMQMEKASKDMQADPPLFDVSATLYCGVHADDGAHWAYPDCTPEFVGGMSNAIFIGTYNKARLRTPLLFDSKADVVMKGTDLNVDFSHTWSCYAGDDLHCGVCPTCRSRKEAFEIAQISDPTEYAA